MYRASHKWIPRFFALEAAERYVQRNPCLLYTSTAEQVNYKTLAEAAEISQPVAKEWVRILQGLSLIHIYRLWSWYLQSGGGQNLNARYVMIGAFLCAAGLSFVFIRYRIKKLFYENADTGKQK